MPLILALQPHSSPSDVTNMPESNGNQFSIAKPSYRRVQEEDSHFEEQLQAFTDPITIPPATFNKKTRTKTQLIALPSLQRPCPPAEPTLTLTPTKPIPLTNLPPESTLPFTNKDCIIYTSFDSSSNDTTFLTLYARIYRHWFPHRSLPLDLDPTTFFAQHLAFSPPVSQVEHIIRFHDSLTESLKDGLAERNASAPVDAVKYLRRTIGIAFIVIQEDDQRRGWEVSSCSSHNKNKGEGGDAPEVLLVWKNESVAKRYGCWEGVRGMKNYICGDGSDLQGAKVFKCSLEDAMSAVVALDEERGRERREWSSVFGEVLGNVKVNEGN